MSLLSPEDLEPCEPCMRRRHAQCALLADLRMGCGIQRWCACAECRPIAKEVSVERLLSAVFEERKQEVLHGAKVLGIKDGDQDEAKLEWDRATRRRRVEVDVLVRLGGRA